MFRTKKELAFLLEVHRMHIQEMMTLKRLVIYHFDVSDVQEVSVNCIMSMHAINDNKWKLQLYICIFIHFLFKESNGGLHVQKKVAGFVPF